MALASLGYVDFNGTLHVIVFRSFLSIKSKCIAHRKEKAANYECNWLWTEKKNSGKPMGNPGKQLLLDSTHQGKMFPRSWSLHTPKHWSRAPNSQSRYTSWYEPTCQSTKSILEIDQTSGISLLRMVRTTPTLQDLGNVSS